MEILIITLLLVIAAEVTYLTMASQKKNKPKHQAPIFVDTSVLIDGRITAIAESGFVSRPLYIPRSVVGELQLLADNGDSDKRARARHGLDIINQLQSMPSVDVVIHPDGVKADEGVDNRLLSLASQYNGALCTIDYNLNKVAVVEGIQVVNVNELAKSLRMTYLPGETVKIELTQKGNDGHQGIGHLADGTMVVVERAHKMIGSVVEIEFIRSLQTAAGKMMFAKLVQAVPGAKAEARKVSKKDQAEASVATKKTAEPEKKVLKGRQPRQQAETAQQKPQASRGQRAASTAANKPKEKVTEKSAVARKAPSRRRRSPEDSLVELANGQ